MYVYVSGFLAQVFPNFHNDSYNWAWGSRMGPTPDLASSVTFRGSYKWCSTL